MTATARDPIPLSYTYWLRWPVELDGLGAAPFTDGFLEAERSALVFVPSVGFTTYGINAAMLERRWSASGAQADDEVSEFDDLTIVSNTTLPYADNTLLGSVRFQEFRNAGLAP